MPIDPAASPSPWMSLARAAAALDMSAPALRRALERRARRAPDGGIEAEIDGVRGRKLGHLWRVQLGERWAAGVLPLEERGRVRGSRTGDVR